MQGVAKALERAVELATLGYVREAECGEVDPADVLDAFVDLVREEHGEQMVSTIDDAARMAWWHCQAFCVSEDPRVHSPPGSHSEVILAQWWGLVHTMTPNSVELGELAKVANVSSDEVERFFLRRKLLAYANLADGLVGLGKLQLAFAARVFDALAACVDVSLEETAEWDPDSS